ncbi:MAG: DUF434 domain-containing protein, partial [Capsulimonadaceae bacterium]
MGELEEKRHRGQNPEDRQLFGPEQLRTLQGAVADLSWLLERGYTASTAARLVGDRYSLHDRQRNAVTLAACSDKDLARRRAAQLPPEAVLGRPVVIDAYSLLVTLETALSGSVLLRCRDGCIRTIADLHGTYQDVEETDRALELAAQALQALQSSSIRWLLDAPVTNSGRLQARMQ